MKGSILAMAIFLGALAVGCHQSTDSQTGEDQGGMNASNDSAQREQNKQQLNDIEHNPNSFSATPTQPLDNPQTPAGHQ